MSLLASSQDRARSGASVGWRRPGPSCPLTRPLTRPFTRRASSSLTVFSALRSRWAGASRVSTSSAERSWHSSAAPTPKGPVRGAPACGRLEISNQSSTSVNTVPDPCRMSPISTRGGPDPPALTRATRACLQSVVMDRPFPTLPDAGPPLSRRHQPPQRLLLADGVPDERHHFPGASPRQGHAGSPVAVVVDHARAGLALQPHVAPAEGAQPHPKGIVG